ncbi:hypothetical protein ACOSQ2_005104 [Xanthoceras sorbifolium]
MVTATRVINLDLEFDEPATRVVDDATEGASVGEASISGANRDSRTKRRYRGWCTFCLKLLYTLILQFNCFEHDLN